MKTPAHSCYRVTFFRKHFKTVLSIPHSPIIIVVFVYQSIVKPIDVSQQKCKFQTLDEECQKPELLIVFAVQDHKVSTWKIISVFLCIGIILLNVF